MDDVHAALRMLGRSLGTPRQASVVEDIRELEHFISNLERDVDAACRATAAGCQPPIGVRTCPNPAGCGVSK
ncbi:MAG: hypothetical protein H6716_24085 [Polyangiaceae bacterium]|nr:hypothetical protein [Polyangiaceae bacterium]